MSNILKEKNSIMNRLLKCTCILLLILLAITVFIVCNNNSNNNSNNNGNDNLAEWTIMIYMSGNDLESGDEKIDWPGGSMSANISEILSVPGQPDDINIIIETGGSKSWKNYNISSTELSRYHVRNQELVLDETLPYESMGETTTYQSFLEWGLTKYPAKHIGVILAGHGAFIEGFCADGLRGNDSLENEEHKLATLNAFNNTNTDKLDFIAYDACNAQVQDIAYYNSQFYKYMLGSQELLSDEGFEYDTWLDDLYQYKDTLTILKAIVDGFFNNINPLYIEHNMDNLETLSILDLSYMESYKQAFENMALDMRNIIQVYDPYEIEALSDWMVDEVKHSELGAFNVIASFDAYDFVNKVENTPYNPGKDHLNKIKSILDDMIIYCVNGPEAGNAFGLSFYFCYDGSYFLSSVKKNTAFTNWMDFLQTYIDRW